MTILLHSSRDLPPKSAYDNWIAVTGTTVALDPAFKFPGQAAKLEMAFMEIRPLWWKLAKKMGADPGADYARAPTATAFGSDFGVMLAWSNIIDELINQNKNHLIICDDPWLFRHLASLPGIKFGRLPALQTKRIFFFLRGVLARLKVAGLMAILALISRPQRFIIDSGDAALLVYAHPRSILQGISQGRDDYFGDLMTEIPTLKRLLHGDSSLADIKRLCTDGRTAAIHAWGSALFAFQLLFVKWKPSQSSTNRTYFWLIDRAAAIENGGGGPAMTCWQMHCQERWLATVRPSCVTWPWENHAWERALCRSARRHKTRTIGYQHTVIGPHQINYATTSNRDGLESIPDWVVADGPAYARELLAWGVPENRLTIGGAFRLTNVDADIYNPGGPVFFPLSSNYDVARQQLEAARRVARTGKRVLVKTHPMYPMNVPEDENLTRTDLPMVEQKNLSIVIYSTGTSGLEAILLGLPAYRLQLDDCIAIDVLPEGISIPTITLETIEEVIQTEKARPNISWDDIFVTVDFKKWHELLSKANMSEENPSTQFVQAS